MASPRLNPFLYPKVQHRRRLSPPVFSTYRPYKPYLRQEFGSQCVYCRLPDGIKGQDYFSVDHYRPKSLFPQLETTYPNLFYACSCCNRRKGKFWPGSVDFRQGRFIPNPCDHVMFEHLRYRGVRVEARTPAGVQADSCLMLNDEESVNYRELLLGLIAMAEQRRNTLRETIAEIDKKSRAYPDQAESLRLEKELTEKEIEKLNGYLEKLAGD